MISTKILLTSVLIISVLSSGIVVMGNKIPFVKAQTDQTASPQTSASPSSGSNAIQPTGQSAFANLSAAATASLVPGESRESAPLLPPAAEVQVNAQKNELQSNKLSASTASIIEEKSQTVVPVDIASALVTGNATTNSTAAPTSSSVVTSANMSSTNSTTSASEAPSAVGNLSSTAPESASPTPQVVNTGVKGDGPDQASCGGFFPPDATIASGKRHVVVMDNLCGAIHLKNGVLLKSFALNPFFNAGTDRTSDPFVSYDIPTDRFFATLMDITKGGVHIAVSKPLAAGGPIAPWATFFLDFKPTPTATDCPDQPFHATSRDKFVVSANVFGNHCENPHPYLGARTAVVNKLCLLGGPCVVNIRNWGVNAFSLHPVLLFGTDQRIVLVSDGFGLNQNVIRMDTCSGSVSPTCWALGGGTKFVPIHTTLIPPQAIQKGTTVKLNTNDGRVLSTHETPNHNLVWLTFNEGCKPSPTGPVQACTRLIEINKALSIPNAPQDFDLGTKNFDLFYGALTVVPVGCLDVLFGASGTTLFPSLFATRQCPGAPVGFVDAPILLKLGLTFSDQTSGSQHIPRYGDYFGASPDISDPISAWLYGEYMKLPNNWGTWINKVF